MVGGFNTVCMYANTEIFQKAGVELPGTDDWTWDDFTAAAKKIKEKTGAYILPFGNAQFTDIMPWLLSNGASTLDPSWTKAGHQLPGGRRGRRVLQDDGRHGLLAEAGGHVRRPHADGERQAPPRSPAAGGPPSICSD